MGRRVAWVMLVLVLVMVGCSATRGPAAPTRCVRMWNATVPEDASDDFDRAIVYRWTDKADDDGCGIIFLSGAGAPWIIFGGVVVDDRVSHWTRVFGERWGEDSPEGDTPTEPNVRVLPGGLLSGL